MAAPGRIATFYSYKGGTGRSMALANFAWILAASGKKILVIDWDLEAPGLHRYFRPFLIDPDLFETDGLIDTFWSFAASALASTSTSPGSTVSAASAFPAALHRAKRRIQWIFANEGYIDFVGAGRQGGTYSEKVNTFDWKRFYELDGAAMLDAAKSTLRETYDWILIDSRTGVSDTAGICTMQLPDIVVPCFTLNRQSIDGVTAVMRSVRAYRSPTVDGSKIEFFPLATRIENAEKTRLEVARRYARSAVSEFLSRSAASNPRAYWDRMELAYRPSYAFEEILAAFGDATDSAGAADTMVSQVEKMSWQITGDDELKMPEVLEADRTTVLAKYALGPSPQDSEKTASSEEETADRQFLRGLINKEQEWRTSGFGWRDLMSSRELELLKEEDRATFGRNMVYYFSNSERGQRFFKTIDTTFVVVWTITAILIGLIALAFFANLHDDTTRIVLYIVYVGSAAYGVVTVLAGALVSWIAERPYGITGGEVIRFVILGPLRPRIYDYESPERGLGPTPES